MFNLNRKKTATAQAPATIADQSPAIAENNLPSQQAVAEDQRQSSATRRHRRSHGHMSSGRRRNRSSGGNSSSKTKLPPASKAAMGGLLHLRLRSEDEMSLKELCPNEECVICAENFADKDVVTTLPCGHMHHSDCILRWLSRNCSCPTCRHEMPTDDQSFERRKARRAEKKTADSVTFQDRRIDCQASSEDEEGSSGHSRGLLALLSLEDVVAMKIMKQSSLLQNYDNLDLIVRRTLRVKEEMERHYTAGRNAGEGEEEDGAVSDIADHAGDLIIPTDTPIDHAHFLELYAGYQ